MRIYGPAQDIYLFVGIFEHLPRKSPPFLQFPSFNFQLKIIEMLFRAFEMTKLF